MYFKYTRHYYISLSTLVLNPNIIDSALNREWWWAVRNCTEFLLIELLISTAYHRKRKEKIAITFLLLL